MSLSELELSRLAAIVQVLKDTSHYHSSSFADADITLLFNLLKSWPLAMMFPGISCTDYFFVEISWHLSVITFT